MQPEPMQPITTLFPEPGQTFRDKLNIGGEGPLMVVVPAGRFLMGLPSDELEWDDSEGPQHVVHITQPFAMGVHAITFDDFDRFCDSTQQLKPRDENWGRGRRPVINISWNEAHVYCVWLSEQTGRHYYLPSESMWEYACRAGTQTPFHTGDRISPEQANFNGNFFYNDSVQGVYRGKTVPVGTFSANAFGLYEMHGNVWEWCQDTWHGNYQDAPSDGSSWEGSGCDFRLLRGGSWYINPDYARSSVRDRDFPDYRSSSVGFRVSCLSSDYLSVSHNVRT
tara:strand:- start:657 stop:1496 length:840 start_codon:yes stop_codon:yes gene_type:complete